MSTTVHQPKVTQHRLGTYQSNLRLAADLTTLPASFYEARAWVRLCRIYGIDPSGFRTSNHNR